MIVKRAKKNSFLFPFLIFILLFYCAMKIMTAITLGGTASFDILNNVLNKLYKINTPLLFSVKNISISIGFGFFGLMVYETIRLQNKRNLQEQTYGSAEWCSPKDIKNRKDKNFENNMILTQTEMISKNMKKSKMNRNVVLIGSPRNWKISFLL